MNWTMRAGRGLFCTLVLVVACRMQEEPSPGAASSSTATSSSVASPSHIRFVKAPPGDVPAAVRRELDAAKSEHREVLVYVGAPWCEPCQRFHAAAERGEVDDAFGSLTLLEFNLDVDQERLETAGYSSQYVPLFAVPGADGRASGRKMDGSVKGPGAIADIKPRLKQLLGR